MLPVGGHIGKLEEYKLILLPKFYKGECYENLNGYFFGHLIFLKIQTFGIY